MPSGWGTYGSNLAYELARRGIEPAIFMVSPELRMTKAQLDTLRPAIEKLGAWNAAAKAGGLKLDFPLLLALNDDLSYFDLLSGARGQPTVGVPFFESAVISAENAAGAKRFDLIIAGSTWNAEVMARHGITHVRTCLQGVDLALFHPGARTGRFKDRFAVFSGGKLEYRKGQDLVVAAFKRFHARRPDALLVTAWHNPWPQLAAKIAVSPHIAGSPPLKDDGSLDVPGWLIANGLPDTAFLDLGRLDNASTPAVLREVDLAIFPNRCEGGTNLVAMEAMACGVPVALSRNTGHLDLIRGDNCYSLDFQLPMGELTGRKDLDGWGETSIDELVSKMEAAYSDREDAERRGVAGAAFMRDWGWPEQVDRLVAALAEFS
jgi:glycosyltransferase involved in cell wall biosynthesis